MVPAFLINLARRADRRGEFLRSNSAALRLVKLELIEAVDGQSLDLSEQLLANVHPWNLDPRNMSEKKLRGVIGCGLSHLACLEKIADGKSDWAVVFEDDAVPFSPECARLFEALLGSIPDVDLIFMTDWARGASWSEKLRGRALRMVSRVLAEPMLSRWDAKFEKTTESYLVSRRYAEKLAESYRTNIGAIDEHIRSFTEKNHGRAYICGPPLFKQRDRTDTDIQQ